MAELLEEGVPPRRPRQVPRGVKRKMSGYPLRPRSAPASHRAEVRELRVKIIK